MTGQTAEADVRLVLTVDLTGPYESYRAVADALREQTTRNVDCHTAIVRLGADAVRHNLELGRSIAAVFFLSAQRIEVHAPAGNVMGLLIHDEVARYVRLYAADHARMTASPAAEAPPG
uniref:STAS domain-containing protein n=1 Tax=Streptomyces sp. NBC_00093 TaxID=2975649 RepID=A0AAU1ZZF5_9ACTN